MEPLSQKHKLDGIGEASAAMVFASFAANPSTIFLTQGLPGKVIFWALTKLFSKMASFGLVTLNVGAEKLATAVTKINFDGSWDSAQELIESIRNSGRELSEEEIRTIDLEVINSFRKFGKLARKKKEKQP